jgi:hypothetical protein
MVFLLKMMPEYQYKRIKIFESLIQWFQIPLIERQMGFYPVVVVLQ